MKRKAEQEKTMEETKEKIGMKKQSKPEQKKDIADATETLDSNIKKQLKEQQEKELVKTNAKSNTDLNGQIEAQQQKDIAKTDPKRHEEICLMSISIEELTSCKAGNVFHGNIIVTYRTTLDKLRKTNEILRADLTNTKGELTITLNIRGNLIKQHEEKIVPGKAICIKNFKIVAKTDYDHGESECILLVDDETTIENIELVCQEYTFIPNTTIKILLQTVEPYAIGTIAAIVTGTKRSGMQYMLDIKDGNSQFDKATLQLFPTFASDFAYIEDKVSKRDYPICLFRNLVRRKEAQANTLRTGQSTFITALRSKKTLIDLQTLLQSTRKVQGKLFASSAYSNPFHPICLNCKLPAENFGSIQGKMLYCTKCEAETNFIYSHRLKCNIINTEGAKVPCTLKSDLLKTVLPALTDLSYENYLTDKSVIIYLIRGFSFEGVFVLDQDDVIVDLRGQLIE